MDRAASSFLYGITVKISEKYRPPRKPTLPAGLCIIDPPAHLFEENFERVDEAGALNLIEKLKNMRNEEVRARKERIAELQLKIKEKKEKQPEEKDIRKSMCDSAKLETPDPIVATPVMPSARCNGQVPLLNHVSMPILTPIQSSTVAEKQTEKLSAINIAEFESFSTNPFEEMELKTLNDKEELALLLQPTSQPIPGQPSRSTQPTLGIPYSTYGVVGMQWLSSTDASYQHQPPNLQYSNPSNDWIHTNNLQPFDQQTVEEGIEKVSLNKGFVPPTPQGILRQVKSVPDLSDIGGLSQTWVPMNSAIEPFVGSYPDKRLSSRTPPPRLSSVTISKHSPRSILNTDSAEEKNLKPHEILLVRQLGDMGFSRDLSVRVISRIGANEKDVLDQILVIQKLEDKGHSRHRIESILQLVKPCQDFLNVLEKHLRLSEQLSALGFEEKKIDSALVAAELDRDKALDILLMM